MKVLLIHQHGNPHGSGAVVSTYRLHAALRAAGIHSTIACRKRAVDDPDIVELPRADALERWLGRLTWRLGLRDIHCVSSFKLGSFEPFLEADLVNIHGWHTNFFSYLALPRLARARPIVTSLHDMWNFTGHCATSLDCERWRTGCGDCPYLEVFPPVPRDATRLEWNLKEWVYRASNMVVTTPSRWLADLAAESMLGRFPIRFIPNGVDTELYQPQDRHACRTALGLPADALIVMFAAAALDNPLKGPDLLLTALDSLPPEIRSNVFLLLAGDRGRPVADATDVPTRDMGYIFDESRKAACYAAADVLVLPTRAEVQGRVLLEAMACGTPCVATDVGGVGESVITGKTGYLATADSADDLGHGLAWLLDDAPLRARLAENGRRFVLEHHTLAQNLEGFLGVFHEALERETS